MESLLLLLLMVGLWVALNVWILPRLGFRT